MGGLIFIIILLAIFGFVYPLACAVIALILKARGEIHSVRAFLRNI